MRVLSPSPGGAEALLGDVDGALGPEARARSRSWGDSDMPAMLRRRGALLALAVPEALRAQGMAVRRLIDSARCRAR